MKHKNASDRVTKRHAKTKYEGGLIIKVCAVIKFLQAEGVNQSEIHRRLQDVYGPDILNRKEVNFWCQKFKDGRTEKKRDRQRTSHTDDNCSKVERLIKEDRRIIVRGIAEVTGIPKSIVRGIISLQYTVLECFKQLDKQQYQKGVTLG
ncbi:hypothetical protein AVEN_147261-1 [Araneus ventricosus]|uniref:Mos1 transposase HTH domain-containing protein n=1 Tax=Araneus ventricosus TaxID=182803 RepID=A0A4Y2UVG6_ARAVE|nr:hypothetical protein AVEN_28828-1 [Araneus ventricosus]GBO15452.1 hypothetical protein AVEN_157989-1 [Araneus ventricosus]GBO15810.1 hypothetical protein AVEN_102416-1 [Araneus ventricosus]GBO15816.1 hypothetical protein AVEN_147261-1 [Araneus ventricosus]